VFDAAIAECRSRTLKHVQLPVTESVTIEYVTNKPWSGYNWHQGNYHSPSNLHHAAPTPTQIAILTTLTISPTRHQVPSGTCPPLKRMGAAAVP